MGYGAGWSAGGHQGATPSHASQGHQKRRGAHCGGGVIITQLLNLVLPFFQYAGLVAIIIRPINAFVADWPDPAR
jgi:hypothetical protein